MSAPLAAIGRRNAVQGCAGMVGGRSLRAVSEAVPTVKSRSLLQVDDTLQRKVQHLTRAYAPEGALVFQAYKDGASSIKTI